MSFILDALKKSEQDRERNQGPARLDVPYGRRTRGQPWWLWLVLALLLVNLIFLLGLWLRRATPAAPPVTTDATATAVAPTAAPAAVAAAGSAAAPSHEVRSLQDEALPSAEGVDVAGETLSDGYVPGGPRLVQPVNNTAALPNDSQPSGPGQAITTETSLVPTLESLGGSGALNLPELHLDIHVYSNNPAERFVFINMHKYLEGQTTGEGPQVERITSDGVQLNLHGKRFLLPRQ